MSSRILLFKSIFIFIWSGTALAQAPSAADVNAMKAQIDTLKADYEMRIQALETQLQEMQAQMLRVSSEGAEPPAAVSAPAAPVTPGVLNPAISVVGNFLARIDDKKVFNEERNRVDNNLNLREAEIDFRVPVDPYADAVLITSLESDTPGQFTADVEEGYVNIKKLPFMQSPLGL